MLTSSHTELVGAGVEKQKAECLRKWQKEGDVGFKLALLMCSCSVLFPCSPVILEDSDLDLPGRSSRTEASCAL